MMAAKDHPPAKNSDLAVRFVSALVLGPVVLGVVYWGGPVFVVLVLAAAGLFLHEWLAITGAGRRTATAATGYLTLGALAVLVHFEVPAGALLILVAGSAGVYFLAGIKFSARWGCAGVLYSGFALIALLLLREGTLGLIFTFFLFFVVWATDIFAYFAGRAIGGPRLWKRVSPKKTWSGAAGGLAGALLVGGTVSLLTGSNTLSTWLMLAALLSVVSQAGDLLESAIKRRFDVKDSSRLIPGHGGVMDRVDGLVAAAIFAVAVGWLSGGPLADPVAGLGLS